MINSVVHKVDGIDRPLLIRWSTDDDLSQIYEWLKEEDELDVHGNFLCNWRLTEKCHKVGKLLVMLDETDGMPIAYQWGQLLQSGILQIRNGWRHKGLGRLLVQHCVELALEQDEMVLQIECEPSSSIPFWKAMGFTVVDGKYGDNPKGYRVLSKQLILPLNGVPKIVRVSVYPEERKWQDILPIVSYSPEAVLGDDGKVYFAERAVFPDSLGRSMNDPVIEILLDGEVVYRDKAKYQEAKDHGVRWCRNGFYVDTLAMDLSIS